MKYTIKHSCGHEETVDLFGTNVHGERDRKVAWLESKPCRECESSQFEDENGLPQLSGSEKQVSWARSIRINTIKRIKDAINQVQIMNLSDKDRETADSRITAMCKIYREKTSAAWWIDNRDNMESAFAKEMSLVNG